jgi:hypothetical protein
VSVRLESRPTQESFRINSGLIQDFRRSKFLTFRQLQSALHGKKDAEMINYLRISATAILACGLLAPMDALAQESDNDGCTEATLKGDYAFRITGAILNAAGAPVDSREGVAMTHFDGKGSLTQLDWVMSNGVPLMAPADPVTGFHIDESGMYKLNPDCTGSAVIHFPAPPGVSSGAEIDLMLVLGNHGRTIHAIVSKLLPPGSSKPVPVAIHSDAEKLGAVPDTEW